MNKLQEIFKAYYKKFNPTVAEEDLASKRYDICKSCPELAFYINQKNLKVQKCGNCGCVISAKIFSPVQNACPLKKWESVDKNSPIFNNAEKLI